MASIYDIKPAFQNLLRPTTNLLAKWHVTANQITLLALFISALNGIAILCYPTATLPILCVPLTLLLRMILNAMDGMLAREHHMQSTLGMFLNEIGDVISDACLYLPFAYIIGISAPLITVIVLLAMTSEFAGVLALQTSQVRRYDGPMGKSDRAFVFGLLGLYLGLGFKATLWVNVLLAIVVLLLVKTIMNRVKHALVPA